MVCRIWSIPGLCWGGKGERERSLLVGDKIWVVERGSVSASSRGPLVDGLKTAAENACQLCVFVVVS
jgi:hypothetical protein